MTKIREVDPFSIVSSEFNERTEETDTTDSDTPNLDDSVEEVGVVEPPKVREFDGDEYDYEVIVGQRRVHAAQAAEIDNLPVIVGGWSDQEALTMSISENVEGFKERVSPSDRASALQTLWEMMDGDGTPSSSMLARELGVPQPTVNTWIEPLRPEWSGDGEEESNEVHYEEEDSAGISDEVIDSLGESTLTEIRNGTESTEEAQEVAERVLEEDLTLSQVKDLRTHIEGGEDLDDAIEEVTQEGEEPPTTFKDFSNIKDTESSDEEVEEIEDPTEATEEPDSSSITDQIDTVDMVEIEVDEGEIDFTLEIPEKTYERAESYAADFGYDSVEDLLLTQTIPDFLNSDEGQQTITDILDEKAKARGH